MAAASSSSSNDVTSAPEFEVPEGWILVTKHNKKGELIKYYTNVLKQRFYSEYELMRNINYSKSRGYNLYAPNFVPPTTGPFAMRDAVKVDAASTSSSRRITRSQTRREGVTSKKGVEVQRARSSLQISVQGNGERPEVEGDCWSSTEVPK